MKSSRALAVSRVWHAIILGIVAMVFLPSEFLRAQSPSQPPIAVDDQAAEGILATLGEMWVKGGVLMYPIGLASILMLGLVLERWWVLRPKRIVPPMLWHSVQHHLQRGEVEGARESVARKDSPVARMLNEGLRYWNQDNATLARELEDAGQREADELLRNLPALQATASISMLLGLLGTIFGMIQCFFTVAKEDALGSPSLLADGIAQALITTAAGLLVAIPSLTCFYAFRGRVRDLVRELDNVARGVRLIRNEMAAT